MSKPYMDLLQLNQVVGRAGRGDFDGVAIFAWNPGQLATCATCWGGVDGLGGEQIQKLARFLDGSCCRRDVLTASAGGIRPPVCAGCDVHSPAMAADSQHPAAVMFITDAVSRAFGEIGATEVLLWSTFVGRVLSRFAEAPAIDDMVANRAMSYLIRVGDLELMHHQPRADLGWAPTLQVRVRPSRRSEHAVPFRPRLAPCIVAASAAGAGVHALLGLGASDLVEVAASMECLAAWAEADDVAACLGVVGAVGGL